MEKIKLVIKIEPTNNGLAHVSVTAETQGNITPYIFKYTNALGKWEFDRVCTLNELQRAPIRHCNADETKDLVARDYTFAVELKIDEVPAFLENIYISIQKLLHEFQQEIQKFPKKKEFSVEITEETIKLY